MRISELEGILKANSDAVKNSMQISDDITDVLKEKGEIKMKKNSVLKKAGAGIASLAAVFVLLINAVPDFAYAAGRIPGIEGFVRVVTFGRFVINEEKINANIVTPKIEGLLDKELEDKLNSEFNESSLAVISAFESDIKELEKEYGEDFRLGVEANYTVRTDNAEILAIDTYIVNTVGSSSTKHSFYNINKKTGELLSLDGLFEKDADFETPINEYIVGEMRKKNKTEGTEVYWIADEGTIDGFEGIKKKQSFFINDAGNIVICFDKYEVAPGAYGCPEFEIPNEVVKDILK